LRAGTELIAVDLDGTLVDSAPDIAHCVGAALESLGFAAPGEARTRGWIGDGIEHLIARALAQAREASGLGGSKPLGRDPLHTDALRAFAECYARNLFVRSRLYPGVTATLDALRRRGLRLCCITNKRIAFSEALLAQSGIRDRFELVLGGDSLPEKKPSPLQLTFAAAELGVAPDRAALVGDSIQDLRSARAAGFAFVWATYGYCTIDDADLAAAPRIERFADLVPLTQ
jgi:phosphoglycolate phosphatase